METYLDRHDAGKQLAVALQAYKEAKNTLVLALPRGGVPVAYEVATALHLPLDIFIVRKLGVPGQEELAMGAIAMGADQPFLNKEVIRLAHVSAEAIAHVLQKEKQELARRNQVYRQAKPFPDVTDKTIILIDDGIATGATLRAAIYALRALHVGRIVVAVPVAAQSLCAELETEVDQLICPLRPVYFSSVGQWYDDFSQTEDEEVFALLKSI